MSGPGPLDRETTFVVVRASTGVAHPHLNTWLPRGTLEADADGRLTLVPNLQDTFEGLAEPTTEIETRHDGETAQVYRLVRAELRTPPRRFRRRRKTRE